MLTDAQSDVTNGATVLLVDPIDSGVGTSIESYAKSHGVAVIDYDRLTLGGSRKYYVSFDNVQVGKVMGQGMVTCAAAWHVAKPNVVVMHGDPTDNNATLFYTGYYNDVLKPLFTSGKWKDVVNPAGTWDPPTALTSFQQAFTAHSNINAALIPNDENGAPIITYLKTKGVKPDTFPTTGQDATLTGLQNVLSGYQCGIGLQGRVQGGRGRGCAGPLPPGRQDTALIAGQRQHDGHQVQHRRALGPARPGVGHAQEHEHHDRQGQVRADGPAVRRCRCHCL